MTPAKAASANPSTAQAFVPLVVAMLGPGARGFLDPSWLAGEGRQLWVGQDEGGPAGCLVAEQGVDFLEIHVVAVEPKRRRRGVAAAMVRAACDQAALGGASEARLEVRADNLAALALYEGLGFRTVGVRPAYYPDGQDAHLLVRAS